MSTILMPRATAVWLVERTSLTFEQISQFTGIHFVEIQAIADGEISSNIQGLDPIQHGQLKKEEIARCEKDPKATLQAVEPLVVVSKIKKRRGPKYVPLSKRADKPDAIAWLVRHHPELLDSQISRLVGTTKPTINAVRDRSHWNSSNIKPRSPIELSLCSQLDFDKEVARAVKAGRAPVVKEEPNEEAGDVTDWTI